MHQQAEGFTDHEVWDFAATRPDQYPLLLHFPYFDLYRKQVVKQADLVLAMQLCRDAFTLEQKARNFDYYERITVRDSSLSACTQAVLAAEVGHLRLALDYAAEAALMDLQDLEHNAPRRAAHRLAGGDLDRAGERASAACATRAARCPSRPRLPDGIVSLSFSIVHRGFRLRVEIGEGAATYRLTGGEGELRFLHHGQEVVLAGGEPVRRAIPPPPSYPEPSQPPGRAPLRRGPG